MQICIELGNDDIFDSQLIKVGFLSAAIETQLRKVVDNPEIQLTTIFSDENNDLNIVELSMKDGKGWNVDDYLLPSYMTYMNKLKEEE